MENQPSTSPGFSPGELADLASIESQLKRNDLTDEQRSDLFEARGAIGESHRKDAAFLLAD